MRPNKPGCWFYENIDGRVFPVIVAERPCDFGKGIELNVVFRMRYIYLDMFEERGGFKRWIGPAHPPKKGGKSTGEEPISTVRFEDFGDELHMTFICPNCGKRSYIDAPSPRIQCRFLRI
jgi:hypothetical protein